MVIKSYDPKLYPFAHLPKGHNVIAANYLTEWMHPVKVIHHYKGKLFEWTSRSHRKRTYNKKHRYLWYDYVWCFHPWEFSWWTGILFTVGSFMFCFSSSAYFFTPIQVNITEYEYWYGFLNLVGSFFYTAGGLSMFGELVTIDEYKNLKPKENVTDFDNSYGNIEDYSGKTGNGNVNDESIDATVGDVESQEKNINVSSSNNGKEDDDTQLCSSLPVKRLTFRNLSFRRVDFNVMWTTLLGACLFNVNSVAGCGLWIPPITPFTVSYLGSVVSPDITASCFFVMTGYLAMVEATASWLPFKPFQATWWLALFYLIGGLGFLLNGIFLVPYSNSAVYQNIPLAIGSWSFLIGSYMQFLEQCPAITFH